VTHHLAISDFDMSRDFVLVRCKEKFFRWVFKSKKMEALVEELDFRQNDFSIISCGHSFLVGVKTKKKKKRADNINKT
jgi:hypothetical protein